MGNVCFISADVTLKFPGTLVHIHALSHVLKPQLGSKYHASILLPTPFRETLYAIRYVTVIMATVHVARFHISFVLEFPLMKYPV